MKRFLSILLVLVLCISVFAACGDKNDKTTDTTAAGVTEAPEESGAETDGDVDKETNKEAGKETEKETTNEETNAETNGADKEPEDETKPGSSDEPDAPSIEDAIAFIKANYKNSEGSETSKDFQLIAKVPIGAVTFGITWSCDIAGIAIVFDAAKGMYTVDIPSQNDNEIEYTLTATVIDSEGNTATYTMKRVLPVLNQMDGIVSDVKAETAYKLYFDQKKAGKVLFLTAEVSGKYIKTTTDAKTAPDFYAEIVEGGVKIYTTVNGTKSYIKAWTEKTDDGKTSKYLGFDAEGSIFNYNADINAWSVDIDGESYSMGTYNTYETASISATSFFTPSNTGIDQFPVEFVLKEKAEAYVPSEGPADPTEYTSITDLVTMGSAMEHDNYTVEKYLVTGTITEISNTTYGNLYIADKDGNSIYVYGLYSKDGSVRFDKMNPQPQVGDTVVLMSAVGQYNGTPQLKNAWLMSSDSTGSAPTLPSTVPVTVDTPRVDTAYKFCLHQENSGKFLYLNGQMSSYYFATTENSDAAADVYLESTEGGYLFYMKNGEEKTYISVIKAMGDDGKEHINVVFNAETPSVYTYDAELKTLVTVVEGSTYYLGTYGSYSTISASTVDKAETSFVCHFVEVVDIAECPHEYENACDTDCNLCGTARETEGHKYDNACDANCNVCDEKRKPSAHVDEDGDEICDVCGGKYEAFVTMLPENLTFDSAANKASADSYMATNFPDWKITGKLGQTYVGYLGFGRSGDKASTITSPEIFAGDAFTVTTVLKGNGSSGVATSTLTFTLVDANGDLVATGYADGATVAEITPADGKDTTYNVSFTLEEGKAWTDVANLVITFAKSTGNIGMKSLTFN